MWAEWPDGPTTHSAEQQEGMQADKDSAIPRFTYTPCLEKICSLQMVLWLTESHQLIMWLGAQKYTIFCSLKVYTV